MLDLVQLRNSDRNRKLRNKIIQLDYIQRLSTHNQNFINNTVMQKKCEKRETSPHDLRLRELQPNPLKSLNE